MIVQNVSREGLTDITFTVMKSEADRAVEVLRPIIEEIGAAGMTAPPGGLFLSHVDYGDLLVQEDTADRGSRSPSGVVMR